MSFKVFMTKSTPPLLTFYMTVKNGMPFLDRSVNSIKNQTYQNFEAVIVDDGSNDGTVSYLEELERTDPRFRVVVTNGVGRGKALNIALNNARGLFVSNLDSDDCAHPQRAELQMKVLQDLDISFLAANCDIVFDDEDLNWKKIRGGCDSKVRDVTRQLFRSNPINHSSATFRRDLIVNLGGYDESRTSQFDYDLWVRLAASGVQLFRLEETLGSKRIHKGQSFENKKRFKYLLSSVALQCSAISRMRVGPYYYFYPVLRLFYGLLPQKLRAYIRRESLA